MGHGPIEKEKRASALDPPTVPLAIRRARRRAGFLILLPLIVDPAIIQSDDVQALHVELRELGRALVEAGEMKIRASRRKCSGHA